MGFLFGGFRGRDTAGKVVGGGRVGVGSGKAAKGEFTQDAKQRREKVKEAVHDAKKRLDTRLEEGVHNAKKRLKTCVEEVKEGVRAGAKNK